MKPYLSYWNVGNSLVFKLPILIDGRASELDGETFRIGPEVVWLHARSGGKSFPHPSKPWPVTARLTQTGWEEHPPAEDVRARVNRELEEGFKLMFGAHALQQHPTDWTTSFFTPGHMWSDSDTKSLITNSDTNAKGRWSVMIRKLNDEWQENAPTTKLLGMWFDANIPLGLPRNPFSSSGKMGYIYQAAGGVIDVREIDQTSIITYHGQGGDWKSRKKKPARDAEGRLTRLMAGTFNHTPTTPAAKHALKDYQLKLLTSFAMTKALEAQGLCSGITRANAGFQKMFFQWPESFP